MFTTDVFTHIKDQIFMMEKLPSMMVWCQVSMAIYQITVIHCQSLEMKGKSIWIVHDGSFNQNKVLHSKPLSLQPIGNPITCMINEVM